jgi:hypothetical protein
MKNDEAFGYLNDSVMLSSFFKRVPRSSVCQLFQCDFIVIFHPKGEPISPHLLCCIAFAVEEPQLHALRLASAATSARE